MGRDNLPGLTPLWLILLAVTLVLFISIMTPAVMSPEAIKASDWIGFAGSALAAGVAALAIYYAWRGIMRQMRVSLISREEDRVEAELPGLRATEHKLSTMLLNISEFKYLSEPKGYENTRDPLGLVAILRAYKIGLEIDDLSAVAGQDRLAAVVDSEFPKASRMVKRELNEILFGIEFWMPLLEDPHPEEEGKALANLGACVEALHRYHRELEARIVDMEARLPKYRREIEEFLAG
jgi:hypothetical protein